MGTTSSQTTIESSGDDEPVGGERFIEPRTESRKEIPENLAAEVLKEPVWLIDQVPDLQKTGATDGDDEIDAKECPSLTKIDFTSTLDISSRSPTEHILEKVKHRFEEARSQRRLVQITGIHQGRGSSLDYTWYGSWAQSPTDRYRIVLHIFAQMTFLNHQMEMLSWPEWSLVDFQMEFFDLPPRLEIVSSPSKRVCSLLDQHQRIWQFESASSRQKTEEKQEEKRRREVRQAEREKLATFNSLHAADSLAQEVVRQTYRSSGSLIGSVFGPGMILSFARDHSFSISLEARSAVDIRLLGSWKEICTSDSPSIEMFVESHTIAFTMEHKTITTKKEPGRAQGRTIVAIPSGEGLLLKLDDFSQLFEKPPQGFLSKLFS